MFRFKYILYIITITFISNCYALSAQWNDLDQEVIQLNEPIMQIDKLNYYSVIKPKLKFKLTDLGVIKRKKPIVYSLQKYGSMF